MDYNSYTFKNKIVDRLNDGDPKKKKTAKLKKARLLSLKKYKAFKNNIKVWVKI